MVNWTSEQSQAINERGKNIIVSASAGSGKTAVLSERVLGLLRDGVDIDKLLIVTFTKLAAGEMRQKISSRIYEEILEKPEDLKLKKQHLLIDNAEICTIDAFLSKLVRQEFKMLNIASDFRIMDSQMYNLMIEKVLEQLLSDYYSDYRNNFNDVINLFGSDEDDSILKDNLIKFYDTMQSIPFFENWMEMILKNYDDVNFWVDTICKIKSDEIENYIKIYDETAENADFDGNKKNPDSGIEKFNEEQKLFYDLKQLLDKNDWDGACNYVQTNKNGSISGIIKKDSDNFYSEKFKIYRKIMLDNTFSKSQDGLKKSQIYNITTNEIKKDSNVLKKGISGLFLMVKDFSERLEKEFFEQNMYTFNKISQLALSLLIENYDYKTKKYKKTTYAEELSKKYSEILIDEYQDINDIQDLIFSALTNNNCFCVGDAKQSIYGFRQSNPDNFLRKKDDFFLIHLNKNFRSKAGILNFVNFIFKQIYTTDFGGFNYDEDEELVFGQTSYSVENTESEIEVHIIKKPQKKSQNDSENEENAEKISFQVDNEIDTDDQIFINEDGESPKDIEKQAIIAANCIKRLINDKYLVTDKKNKRPVELKDFAILLRAMSKANIYEQVFRDEKIPLYLTENTSIFETVEVNTVLSFLKCINNPFDDIAMFGVMYAPFFGFNMGQIVNIKTKNKKKSLYDAVWAYAENEQNEKCAEFLRQLEYFRELSKNIPIHKLIWNIYTKTHYTSIVSSYENGEIRYKNLMKFYMMAQSFSENFSGGIAKFIQYIEITKEKELKNNVQSESMAEQNFVRILTVHKSKGLEFPICILSELNQKPSNHSEKLYIDKDFGIACNLPDDEMIYEMTTLQKEIIKNKKKKAEKDELLRILYVAMTRAREKLILIVNESKEMNEKNLINESVKANLTNKKIEPIAINSSDNFWQLLYPALIRNSSVASLHGMYTDIIKYDGNIEVFMYDDVKKSIGLNIGKDAIEDKIIDIGIDLKEIKRRFGYTYNNNDLLGIPAKISVTELIKQVEIDKYSQDLIEISRDYPEPEFIQKKLSPAKKGTILHTFLQYADLSLPIDMQCQILIEKGLLSQDEAKTLDLKKIEIYANSDLYKKILSSKSVKKEEQFIVNIPIEKYLNNQTIQSEKMLMQGAVDLLCETEDGLMIVDYKTDRNVDAQTLIDRYKLQVVLYKEAVEKMYMKKVSSVYLWSFELSQAIKII